MTSEEQRVGKTETAATRTATSTAVATVTRWREKAEGEYRRIKENAETYPYAWASYGVVYGVLGFWTAYRWRKLRKTETRVRDLQEQLRKLVESEESAATSTSTVTAPMEKPHHPVDKPQK
ncbi:hypothetical protein GIB67_012807 [Kingdonia uniflora]|uniref:Transmembrane protein n=1 Tax=Kingdonia uniflora TaxID=39325 RepID=A0A7J7NFY5_9MAGN|nr:hypothetical protein GIB67_012807 [Kingdonia uniflora]